MRLVRVVHIAPVSRGFHSRMRTVRATCKPQRRSSLNSNHETGLASMIRAAYMQRHRFPVTGGAAPMARAANTRDAASTSTGAMIGSINGSSLSSYFTRLIEVRVALRRHPT